MLHHFYQYLVRQLPFVEQGWLLAPQLLKFKELQSPSHQHLSRMALQTIMGAGLLTSLAPLLALKIILQPLLAFKQQPLVFLLEVLLVFRQIFSVEFFLVHPITFQVRSPVAQISFVQQA
jgi:hypothetical protein